MKDKNYIIIGSSGGTGSQLIADLNDCQSNLLLGYYNKMPKNGFSVLKSAPVDAASFDPIMNSFAEAFK